MTTGPDGSKQVAQCKHCIALGIKCTYDYQPKKRGPPNLYVLFLSSRIAPISPLHPPDTLPSASCLESPPRSALTLHTRVKCLAHLILFGGWCRNPSPPLAVPAPFASCIQSKPDSVHFVPAPRGIDVSLLFVIPLHAFVLGPLGFRN